MARKSDPAGAYRATVSFAAAAAGFPRVVRAGDLIGADDPLVRTHRGLLQPVSEFIEQTTQAPGEARPVRLPTAVTVEQATQHRTGHAHREGEGHMPHNLPPEHEDSPASPFAPGQPAAGVVADDVPAEQNPSGGPKAADAPTIEQTPPEPQTPLQEANAAALKEEQDKANKGSSSKK